MCNWINTLAYCTAPVLILYTCIAQHYQLMNVCHCYLP
uniref:Uncharacterized protein n=1 Tax=Arundo donax TaxID=35708 RepID=A0A0A9TYJ2_ARUDO